MTGPQWDACLARLAAWGPARAAAAIEYTIANGWAGIREEDHNGRPAERTGTAAAEDYRRAVAEQMERRGKIAAERTAAGGE